MTRSQAEKVEAPDDALRPLIAGVTRSVLPWLIGRG
jgi:hypothetical protein